ncbi:AraC family transcriptional regulator, transcriptional activator FtrA [Micromonospora phaseoli]|uniref:AraC family transcriptional regulator, transcriptional activator FtrA n=1 Tax=Micromonospora phaseoli TaxID=1144548 RepID=A0A1H6RIF2_9ACTN|nr:helix-turn-helix domain-containing protein [Micromonospora phaseoli]PZW03307.1 AraC family transcriptional activator FtrA [Micromonospora phaseoli]GIJ78359.1 transcriptional regulator FtrA [Micromonospora phaseoli]SEI50972.1 AraC family transcriptional regulator, transcriptional activator FtrA [Micromonospora phaseoli]
MAPVDRSVAVLAYPGMSVFETGIVTEVFGLPRPELGVPWYDLRVCAERPGPTPVLGGASLHSPHGLAELAAAATVIVPGVPDVHGVPSPELVAALRRAHRAGARVLSICSGAFALAGAGLLDGRRATTHWRYAELLARRYPRVQVDPDVLYLDDGDILTSAGSAAGLDLCVHVVRRDHGAAIANAVARRLVIPPHRDGGQAQFIEAPVALGPDDDRIAGSIAWALANLTEPLTVARLARQAHMSPRTYLRHFARATGTSPIRWLVEQRIRTSLALLETTDAPVAQIATAVGFDAPVTYRHHFARAMRTSPSAYRRAFRSGSG